MQAAEAAAAELARLRDDVWQLQDDVAVEDAAKREAQAALQEQQHRATQLQSALAAEQDGRASDQARAEASAAAAAKQLAAQQDVRVLSVCLAGWLVLATQYYVLSPCLQGVENRGTCGQGGGRMGPEAGDGG
jgi:hypothetical protein